MRLDHVVLTDARRCIQTVVCRWTVRASCANSFFPPTTASRLCKVAVFHAGPFVTWALDDHATRHSSLTALCAEASGFGRPSLSAASKKKSQEAFWRDDKKKVVCAKKKKREREDSRFFTQADPPQTCVFFQRARLFSSFGPLFFSFEPTRTSRNRRREKRNAAQKEKRDFVDSKILKHDLLHRQYIFQMFLSFTISRFSPFLSRFSFHKRCRRGKRGRREREKRRDDQQKNVAGGFRKRASKRGQGVGSISRRLGSRPLFFPTCPMPSGAIDREYRRRLPLSVSFQQV